MHRRKPSLCGDWALGFTLIIHLVLFGLDTAAATEVVRAAGYDWAVSDDTAQAWARANLAQDAFRQCLDRGVIGTPRLLTQAYCSGGRYCSDAAGCRYKYWCDGMYECRELPDLPASPILAEAEAEGDDGFSDDIQAAYRDASWNLELTAREYCSSRGFDHPPEFIDTSGYCVAARYCNSSACRWRAWCDGTYLCR